MSGPTLGQLGLLSLQIGFEVGDPSPDGVDFIFPLSAEGFELGSEGRDLPVVGAKYE